MKVLHVISNLNPHSGGPTTVVRTLTAYQVRSQMEVTICTTNLRNSCNKNTHDNSSHIEDGVEYKYFPSLSPLLISFAMLKWLQKHLGSFDLVHIHGLYRFPVTFAAWWARIVGVPYIIMPHGSLDPYLYRQSRYNIFLKRIYERLFDIPNLNHSSAIHYTAEEEAKRAAFLGLRARTIILPIGIDWEIYKSLPSKGFFRKRLKIHNQTPLVLFLGRINFKKGIDLLVSAFCLVNQEFPDARLAVVGPDNDGYGIKVRQWCKEQKIEDKVLYVGYLEPEEVKQAYVDANVFVLPSYTENFGLTAVEAMACGTPIVISDQVNIWRELNLASAGITVKLEPYAIAQAVLQLLSNTKDARDFGSRGRIFAENNYAWPRVIEQLTEVYQELIADRPSKDRYQQNNL